MIVGDYTVLDHSTAAAIDVDARTAPIDRERWAQRSGDVVAYDALANGWAAIPDVDCPSATAAGSGTTCIANQLTIDDRETLDDRVYGLTVDQEKSTMNRRWGAFDVYYRQAGTIYRLESDTLPEQTDVAIAVTRVRAGLYQDRVTVRRCIHTHLNCAEGINFGSRSGRGAVVIDVPGGLALSGISPAGHKQQERDVS